MSLLLMSTALSLGAASYALLVAARAHDVARAAVRLAIDADRAAAQAKATAETWAAWSPLVPPDSALAAAAEPPSMRCTYVGLGPPGPTLVSAEAER